MEKRKFSEYMGFDDRWFMAIGIIVLALLTTYLFNNTIYCFVDFLISFLISFLFTVSNWLLMRWAIILLRKRFPLLEDSAKRILIFLVVIVLVIVGIKVIGDVILEIAIGPTYHGADINGMIVIGLISIMTMAIYEAIYYMNKLKQAIIKEEQVKQIVVESQMDALRNQARPHFLFNSLNTLKDIIDHDSKEDATLFVDRIADVYRFILETGKANVVTLEKEIAFSKSYVHIQKERFGDNLIVVWDIPDDKMFESIIPMSIQLLLENAIKHNVVSNAKPLTVRVSYENEAIKVTNDLQPKSSALPSTKLGLANIIKRYELSSQKLPVVEKSDTYFEVTVPLFQH